MPVLPNKLVEVPLGAPKPKPVLVEEEEAGWLKVLEPKRPPGGTEQEEISFPSKPLGSLFFYLVVSLRNKWILSASQQN